VIAEDLIDVPALNDNFTDVECLCLIIDAICEIVRRSDSKRKRLGIDRQDRLLRRPRDEQADASPRHRKGVNLSARDQRVRRIVNADVKDLAVADRDSRPLSAEERLDADPRAEGNVSRRPMSEEFSRRDMLGLSDDVPRESRRQHPRFHLAFDLGPKRPPLSPSNPTHRSTSSIVHRSIDPRSLRRSSISDHSLVGVG
jgi:hypothetical protein